MHLEERYSASLRRYLLKNSDKREIDFLNFEIERAEIYISENKDIEKLEKKTIKSFYERNNLNKDDFPYNDVLLSVEIQGIINGVRKNLYFFKRSIELCTKKLKLERLLQKEEDIDYSDEKDIDKIRYLIELGVIDYLSKNYFAHSVSSLSIAISGVTGIKQTTIKGYLNGYLNNPDAKQNPMNSEKAVDRIRMKLNDIGFKK
jgi:hypothetical protein